MYTYLLKKVKNECISILKLLEYEIETCGTKNVIKRGFVKSVS